jgi:hypothetical protein
LDRSRPMIRCEKDPEEPEEHQPREVVAFHGIHPKSGKRQEKSVVIKLY